MKLINILIFTFALLSSCGDISPLSSGSFNPGSTKTIVSVSGAYRFIDGSYATTCLEYRNAETYKGQGDGKYWIDPDGTGGNSEFKAHCDMTTNGGGWTLLANRAGGTMNLESCGSDLSDFFSTTCGSATSIAYGDSYSIGAGSVRDSVVTNGEWRFVQYDSGGIEQTSEGHIIRTPAADLFFASTGLLNSTQVTSVCDKDGLNCDTTDVYFQWIGNGEFNSGSCNGGPVFGANEGAYGYCHNNVLAAYNANSLFGARDAFDEVKLWNQNVDNAKDYQEQIWGR